MDQNILIKRGIKDIQHLSKIDVIIVSVNYNDFLPITLENNIKIFDNITVVTSINDEECQKICQKFNVNCVVTERMYDNGASFNKGKAINEGIKSLLNPNWILLLDADIIVPETFHESFKNNYTNINSLYVCNRIMFKEYESYLDWKYESGLKGQVSKLNGIGYFQLFNINSNCLQRIIYSENSDNAAGSDISFRNRFTEKVDLEIESIHLGISYQNWNGRKTPDFIKNEVTQFENDFNKNTIKVNKYKICSYYFNLKNDPRLKNNFLRFIKQFEGRYENLIVGLVDYSDIDFELPCETIIIKGDVDNKVWSKEIIINKIIDTIDNVDYLMWIDGDLIYDDLSWLDNIDDVVKDNDFVQLFENVNYLNENEQITHVYKSICFRLKNDLKPMNSSKILKYEIKSDFKPGLSWLGKFSILKDKKIFEKMYTGDGDIIFLYGINGVNEGFTLNRVKESNLEIYNEAIDWINSFGRYSLGYLNQTISHLYHGEISDRDYIKRGRYKELLKLKEVTKTKYKEFDLNTHFDKIYCLNLDRRIDRWRKVSKEFSKISINVERWSAIDGDNLTYSNMTFVDDKIGERVSSIIGKIENKYALGCLLSHLQIIKDAKEKGHRKILIFEDDIILSNNFLEEVKQIEKLNWKLLYLGASQFLWNNIEIKDGYYNCQKTLGTFAYAIDSSIYDDLINIFEKRSQSVDNLLSIIQSKYKNECFTIYPNIVISNVENSDIRSEKNISTYANSMRWNLNMFNNKIKILLVPDVENWAFDNIAKSIIKYNPYPDKIEYTIKYAKNIHQKIDIVALDDWDLVFVMWEAERIVPDGDNVIRGCYSAFWLENKFFSEEKISEFFKSSRGGVFANGFLKDSICKFLPKDYPQTIIHDSTDENKFYPIDNLKEKEFTAVFVGNTNRKIKNYKDIVDICKISGIKLITCTDISNEELVNYYNKADICINFSTFEGGPQTFLESSLCEVPMLIRSNNELSKLIPCFKGDDKEDFSRISKKLKNNREECKEVGRKARNIVLENFTYEKTAKKFADFFLKVLEIEPNINLDKKDLSKFLTVFIIRSGDNPNYEDCLNSLNNQSIKFNLIEIKDVAPMSKAFQKMIDNCETDYYIQVDEDMILFEDTIEKIYDRLIITEDNISTVAHMLNDNHLDFDIYGIKAYKHKIMKNYPYNLEIISCEVEQMTRLQNDGFETFMYSEVVGYHSPKWTEQLIYERYFDLMEKWKVFKYDWLSELPAKLMEIFKLDPSNINLFALMGAMTSISNEEPIRNREKNFLIKDKNFERIERLISKEEFKFIRNDKKSNIPQILDKNYVKK